MSRNINQGDLILNLDSSSFHKLIFLYTFCSKESSPPPPFPFCCQMNVTTPTPAPDNKVSELLESVSFETLALTLTVAMALLAYGIYKLRGYRHRLLETRSGTIV